MERFETDRLQMAEDVLTYWEEMIQVGGLSIENLPLALDEVKNLERRRAEDPARVDDLVRRFQAIADGLRRGAN